MRNDYWKECSGYYRSLSKKSQLPDLFNNGIGRGKRDISLFVMNFLFYIALSSLYKHRYLSYPRSVQLPLNFDRRCDKLGEEVAAFFLSCRGYVHLKVLIQVYEDFLIAVLASS